MTPPVDMGIAGVANRLGTPYPVRDTVADYVPDPDRVLRWGYETYHRLDDDVTTTELCADAGRRALTTAGLSAAEVDAVVLVTTGIPDYLYWDPSAALARDLAVREGVPTLWLNQGCMSGTTAFGTIAGMFAVQPELVDVLLVVVNRVSEFHRNRMKTNACLTSDGASAAVIRRGHGRCRWLATDQFTDPELCDWYRLEFGGSVRPRPPEDWSNLHINPLEFVRQHFRHEPARFTEFFPSLDQRIALVVDRACARAGITSTDVTRLVYLNANQQTISAVARAVGIPVERTNAAFARDVGHVGAADQLLCLQHHIEAGELSEGDVVALTGMSSGLHWFCTLIEV